MQIITSHRSPNFTDLSIPVEYVVVHYTASDLKRTLEILTDPATEVSSHIVIDRDGAVYELVPCLDGTALRAWHAGKSRLEVQGRSGSEVIESFNDRSIGIELVNLNGNLLPYTEAQYASLVGVVERLKRVYPALNKPESVIGHEQIAGFRGKCDPGLRFEWQRFFAVCYPNQGAPRRAPVCKPAVIERVAGLLRALGVSIDERTGEVDVPKVLPVDLFTHVSSLLESALSREG